MRFQISAELAESISLRIRQYATQHEKFDPTLAVMARQLDALPLWLDMGGCVALRPDGQMIEVVWDDEQHAREATNPQFIYVALVVGSKRYPELSVLLPQRGKDSRGCPMCMGTGKIPFPEDVKIDPEAVVCYCGGAGWLPSWVPLPGNAS